MKCLSFLFLFWAFDLCIIPSHAQLLSNAPKSGSIAAERLDNAPRDQHPHRVFELRDGRQLSADHVNVDLSVFHSVEAPPRQRHNGITPFVLAQDAFPRSFNRDLIVKRVNALLKDKR